MKCAALHQISCGDPLRLLWISATLARVDTERDSGAWRAVCRTHDPLHRVRLRQGVAALPVAPQGSSLGEWR